MSPPWLNYLLAALGVPAARLARAEALASRDFHTSAFPLFAQAARAGLQRAWYRLGRCYLLGLGVPPSIDQALRWLECAAAAGETAAQTQLAALALQGLSDRGTLGLFGSKVQEADFDRADYWSRQAAAAGSAEAKTLLGFIMTAGPENHRDQAKGETLYREAAEAGWPGGQLGLAMALLREGRREHAEQAVDLLRSAAVDGIAVAHYLLGVLAETGAAGTIDFDAAAASYKEAAQLGNAPAQVRYGFALLLGRGIERDVFKAETWLRRAGLMGDSQASAVVGYLYAHEGDLPPNYAEAAQWLRRAAASGHAAAARTLGCMLLLGCGLSRDRAEAAQWLRIAGENGDETARANLLHLALTRQIGEDDRQAAAGWVRANAEAGDSAAQFSLGLCLAQGVGVEQDNLAAFAWIRRAAGGGNADATRMLAQLGACA